MHPMRIGPWLRAVAALAVVAALATSWIPASANAKPAVIAESSGMAEPYVVEQLTQIADDVYVFSMTDYNALFIVTPAGSWSLTPSVRAARHCSSRRLHRSPTSRCATSSTATITPTISAGERCSPTPRSS